ncbi:hypothetical protein [Limnoglobus roseus]|uniref:VWA domain-containing protein n=1 Tax=Limnoglobus roseus TaxID=2598579 RepID=A0A5C1AKH4_9BACT|nr:hypothetical protein [Limnoglobus roseus]QEL18212.1 VWA domain-containing protein [Limnoglobus roseus]
MPVLFAELAVRGWFPTWLAVLMGLAAVASVVFLYRREAGRISVGRRVVMAALRAATLATILFLILRPSWLTETHGERPKAIAFLIDDSQSMATHDPRLNFADKWRTGVAFNLISPDKSMPANPSAADIPDTVPEKPSRIEVVKAALANPKYDLLKRLDEIGPLQPATFGLRRNAKDVRDAKWVAGLAGTEQRTAIADACFDLLRRDENEQPAAIVIVTDGRENASDHSLTDLAAECARLQVPLHIYGVGSSVFGQLQIREAIVNETLFADDTVSVPVRYRLKGFQGGTVEMVMKLNGQEVARKTVDAKEGEDLKEVLSFVPQQRDAQSGKQQLTTTVRVLAGAETITDEIAKSVRVVDRKVKVLMVDSTPRWDFKFLQRSLLRDRRVVASFILTDGDPRAMKSGEPFLPTFPATRQDLFAFDLLILGDVPAAYFNPDQQVMIREFVAEGGGFIHIAGRNNGPSSFVGTPIADVLPVEIQSQKFALDTGTRADPYRPELTPTGVRSSVLSLDDDPVENLKVWKTLPELYWHYPVSKLRPAAEAYLVHPKATTTDGKPCPLLASHYYGKGYSVWVGFDETWRWRFNEGDKFFSRFWSQGVYIAGVPRTTGTKLTQLSLDTPDPLLGKTGQIYARVFNTDLRPLTTDRMEARLERLDAGPDDTDRSMPVDLKALPGVPGEYVATIPFNRVGRFALRVDNGSDVGSLEYRVTLPPDHELAQGGLAEEQLRKLAEATGGKFYREEDLAKLPTDVKPKTAPFSRRDEVLLWNKWALFLVIGLFSVEWIVRKFNSLS